MSTTNEYKTHIANFWNSKGDGISCTLCPHSCFLKEGEIGICNTRKNKSGNLVALTYGYPCAIHNDPIEKKPLYHFLPGTRSMSLSTTGCNLRCLNCQNYSISQVEANTSQLEYISPEEIVKKALLHNCQSISYTYTDPVVYYEYAKDTAIVAKENGLKNIIVSAGYINTKPLKQLCQHIHGANIDLKSFAEETYLKLSKVKLPHVLKTLETIKEQGVWLEITNLIIPGYSDDLHTIEKMCKWLFKNGFYNTPIHFSRFFPTHQLNNLNPTPLQILLKAFNIAKNAGLNYVYLGNSHLSQYENTYCPHCGSLLIERNGYTTQITSLREDKCRNCNSLIPGFFNKKS